MAPLGWMTHIVHEEARVLCIPTQQVLFLGSFFFIIPQVFISNCKSHITHKSFLIHRWHRATNMRKTNILPKESFTFSRIPRHCTELVFKLKLADTKAQMSRDYDFMLQANYEKQGNEPTSYHRIRQGLVWSHLCKAEFQDELLPPTTKVSTRTPDRASISCPR